MLGNSGSRVASWLIGFMPTSRWHGFKRFLLRRLGGIQVGERTTIFSGAKFVGRNIKIGSDCHIGSGCFIMAPTPNAPISIGDWSSFGPDVFMTTGTHSNEPGTNHRNNGMHLPITVGHHCGLSVRCMIMAGVSIGDYCVISPGVVVSRNIKSNTLVAPAPVRQYHFDKEEKND